MSEWSKRVGDVGEEINDKDSNDDAIRQVDRVVLPESLKYEAIYLVDNKRAQFLFDSVNFARHIAKGADLSFFYADTGKNVHPLSRTNHGPFLPVEYVNTTVLALRIADQTATKRVLVLSTLEGFSETGLKRLLGLAQTLSQDWCTKIVLAFSDFNTLNHHNVVQIANNPDHISWEFEIERIDLSKNWTNVRSNFKGELRIEKEGRKVKFTLIHTAEETKEVNRKLVRHLEHHFKDNGDMKRESTMETILFSSFDNECRIAFFRSLTDKILSRCFQFLKISDRTDWY